MKKRWIFLTAIVSFLLVISNSNYLFAQKETYNWYFGYRAGITFNPNVTNPRALTDCPLSFIFGCATISGRNGNLLFYTDGSVVNNKNHLQMPNGYSLGALQEYAESATIVPYPGNNRLYYIFTIDTLQLGALFYSIVDITKNGGLGDVVVKHRLLSGTTTANVEAVRHRNNKDIWLVTHGGFYYSDRFCVFLLTSKGIIDSVVTNTGTKSPTAWHPFMNSSWDGSKLATALYGNSVFEYYDFDNSTGIPSNPVTLGDKTFIPMAVEFSYDG